MLSELWAKVKGSPVTTVSGWLALASGWVSQQADLAGHPSGKQVLQALAAGAAALFAAAVADAKK